MLGRHHKRGQTYPKNRIKTTSKLEGKIKMKVDHSRNHNMKTLN